jgi:hypothetical protein
MKEPTFTGIDWGKGPSEAWTRCPDCGRPVRVVNGCIAFHRSRSPEDSPECTASGWRIP